VTEHTQRFTGRVEDYARYRPGYPPELLDLLRRECGLTKSAVVADVGSGTGILARLILENGNRVVMVEPNDEMRHVGERLLSGHGTFESVAGTAEATTLPESSADLITAGQAFHWFEPEIARKEFARVLRPDGRVVLVWNDRRKRGTPFLEAYERLLETYATDYAEVEQGREASLEEIRGFFAPNPVHTATFANRQVLDHDGLLGRLRSSSYVPAVGEAGHREMLHELERVFRDHQGGRVVMEYDTRVYYGLLSGPSLSGA
jgi:SAM-dependent methyltransferase